MNNLSLLDDVVISRKNRAINLLKKYDVDGWLVISSGNDVNAEYLVGTKVYGTITILLLRDSLTVLVSKLEESMVRRKGVDEIMSYYGSKELITKLMELLSRVEGGKIFVNIAPPLLAPYASRILYSHERIIRSLAQLYGVDLIPAHKYVWELRSIKTNEELEALEQAVKATVEAINTVLERVKIGMREKEVAAELYREIYRQGTPSFETIVAFGVNSANPHHKTSDKKLRVGEVGYIDVGIKLYSMCADITRAFFTENVDEEFYTIYSIVHEAQNASIEVIREGAPAKEPDKVAREVIKKNKYDPEKVFTHGLGHPIGVEVHDVGPVLSFLARPKHVLKENMTETVEPAIYIENKGGIRLEDDIIVKKHGVVRLSKSPEEPYIVK